MFDKKFLMILGILVVVSFGGALAVSMLFGGPAATTEKAPPKQASTGPRAVLDELGAARPTAQVSARQEQLRELIKDLELRINEYKRKAERIEQREQRMAIAETNLKRRAEELEKLRTELIGPLTRLKGAMAQLDSARVNVAKEERTQLLRIAASYERMDPIKGGVILASMYLGGQKNDVAKILYYMSERGSAKLLAEIEEKDPETQQLISAELTAMMKAIREQG